MKNRRLSTIITIIVLIVNTICISLLYLVANRNMTAIMKQSEMENLKETLNVHTNIIEEYIYHQEDMLNIFSDVDVVRAFLKDPENEEKKRQAQEYTEKYYAGLDNWEGLYIGEWDTHVIAHSDPNIIGMVTRTGEPLKQLQNEMTVRNGLYNAGIIVSPASQKLLLSLYCPVYDDDGKTVLGYVGGGPYVEELEALLACVEDETTEYYMINVLSKMYIFAEDKSLMATDIKEEMLLSLISTINENEDVIIGSKEYFDSKNGRSLAAYEYIPEYGWAVVSCNSEKNIYADVNRNMKVLAVICIISDVVIGVLSWLFIRLSTRPLKYVETAIIQLKELKLKKDPRLNKYINGESEIAQIATAIDSLYDSIKDMLNAEKEKQVAIAASESKARFLASMSHEIRTPINIVIGMNEMILRENQDETIQEYAYNIKGASHMLLGLVNDVLDLSKIEAGKLQIVECDYHTSSLLNDVVLGVKGYMNQKQLRLNLEMDETIPAVLNGDEIRIKQILNNLLSNAVKYTDEGSVTFSAKAVMRENDFSLLFTVTDTGRGIRQEDLDKLFEGFIRLEMDKNRYIEGTGLGLNITKLLVDNMGGTIEVHSEYGKGSSFTVSIPQKIIDVSPMGDLQQAYKQEVKKNSDEKLLYAPDKKILVVDDNKMNLTVIGALLKRSKLQVEFATSGMECLEKAKVNKFDLILMDHMMPEMDGIQTFHYIRETDGCMNQQTPVIVLTANALDGMREYYMGEGFADYLSKPIEADKLEQVLGRLLN